MRIKIFAAVLVAAVMVFAVGCESNPNTYENGIAALGNGSCLPLSNGVIENGGAIVAPLNGEIAVNGVVIDTPAPFIARGSFPTADGGHVTIAKATMVPFSAVALELGLDIMQLDLLPPLLSVGDENFNVSFSAHSAEVQINGEAAFALPVELYYCEETFDTFVPIELFRDAFGFEVDIIDGRVVICEPLFGRG